MIERMNTIEDGETGNSEDRVVGSCPCENKLIYENGRNEN